MASKINTGFGINILPDEVIHTNITVSKDDYNSARLVARRGDKEYLVVSCEWQGKVIPSFAMDLMAFMKSNNVEKSGIWPGKEKAYAEFLDDKKEED
jgi:hypothetical protein